MASWKDGAAYAPIERPDGFATPNTSPLSVASPLEKVTPGAVARPTSLEPVSAPPLGDTARATAATRDPQRPFDVQSAAMTTAPALPDGQRDPLAPYAVTTAIPTSTPDAPPPPPNARPLPEGWVSSQAQRSSVPLLWLCVGMCAVGLLLPTAGTVLLVLAGLLSVLRVEAANKLGGATVGLGATLLLIQLLLPPVDVSLLVRITCLGLGAGFTVLAVRKSA